jgi:TolA-binding protein
MRLAHTMMEQGAPLQAIETYKRVAEHYPGSDDACDAIEELMCIARKLQSEGKVYTALNIFNKVEELA